MTILNRVKHPGVNALALSFLTCAPACLSRRWCEFINHSVFEPDGFHYLIWHKSMKNDLKIVISLGTSGLNKFRLPYWVTWKNCIRMYQLTLPTEGYDPRDPLSKGKKRNINPAFYQVLSWRFSLTHRWCCVFRSSNRAQQLALSLFSLQNQSERPPERRPWNCFSQC